jgi:hypothetical protein
VAVAPCSPRLPIRLKPCMQPETDRKITSISIFRRLAASSPTAFEGSGFDGQRTRTAALCKASHSLIGPRIPSSERRSSYPPNTVDLLPLIRRTTPILNEWIVVCSSPPTTKVASKTVASLSRRPLGLALLVSIQDDLAFRTDGRDSRDSSDLIRQG